MNIAASNLRRSKTTQCESGGGSRRALCLPSAIKNEEDEEGERGGKTCTYEPPLTSAHLSPLFDFLGGKSCGKSSWRSCPRTSPLSPPPHLQSSRLIKERADEKNKGMRKGEKVQSGRRDCSLPSRAASVLPLHLFLPPLRGPQS